MHECKLQHCLIVSYNKSKITMMITAMMSNRATITPMTGPTALLPLLLAPVDCCGEVTI